MRLIRRRRSRGTALVLVAITIALSGASALSAQADDPPATPPPAPVDSAVFADPSSTKVTLTQGNSTVSVSRTNGLTRQMLNVSWTGMQPSGQLIPPTFPVTVMQCRGYNPTREDCWMSDQLGNWPGPYRGSSYAPKENSQWQLFPGDDSGTLYSLPFRKANGKYHTAPNPDLEPGQKGWLGTGLANQLDTSTIDDYTPGTANQRIGVTRPDGTGEVQTWANTKAENPSLGCTQNVPCSLVVVPVTQHPCLQPPAITDLELEYCTSDAMFQSDAIPAYWPLLANWYKRFVFKLSFAPAATACLERSDSAKFLGSELVAEAMRRWVPARCEKASPSSLDFTRGWEPDSRRQLGQPDPIAASGYEADGAIVSEPTSADELWVEKRKPAYAPVAISGFAIGFNWDKSEASGGGQVPQVNLNARLVAKLITQSYPGKYRTGNNGPVNPNAPTNPSNLLNDPEFQQLNPDALNWAGLTAGNGTQMAIPVFKSDVIMALTRWIWADPSARSFMQGKADQWGMTVNKTYKGWEMPRDDYQLNDGWVLPKGQNEWTGFAPQALWAQSSNSWSQGADVLMTAWPLTQSPIPPLKPGLPTVPKREGAQNPGIRNVLALSTTSELEKAGIPMVQLQNSSGEFVSPTNDSMTYALDGATANPKTGIWQLNLAKMDKRGYPGTMVSYAEVPTATLTSTDARRYAENLRFISTEGQLYGQEAGQLPNGYLALTDPMREQAARVADAVENQTGTVPVPPKTSDPIPDPKDPTPEQTKPTQGPGDQSTTTPSDGKNNPTNPPSTPVASGNPTKGGPQAQGPIKNVSQQTEGESLGWLAWGIPALLVAGLAAGIASPGIRVIAQPDHPVHRGVVAAGSYLAGKIRRRRR